MGLGKAHRRVLGRLISASIGRTAVAARRFARQHTVAAVAAVVVAFMVFMAVAAPLLAPEDPLFAVFTKISAAPDGENLLGTDQIGRDLLSRTIYGARISLFVALVAVSLGTGVGFSWGISSGFIGGKFDLISQRLVEIILSLPGLILAMALAIALGASVWTVIFRHRRYHFRSVCSCDSIGGAIGEGDALRGGCESHRGRPH